MNLAEDAADAAVDAAEDAIKDAEKEAMKAVDVSFFANFPTLNYSRLGCCKRRFECC